MIGPVVRPKGPTLGDRIALARPTTQPNLPFIPRPEFHRTGAPPTMDYHKHHPMLTSPAVQPALTGSPTGPSQRDVSAYLKALRNG